MSVTRTSVKTNNFVKLCEHGPHYMMVHSNLVLMNGPVCLGPTSFIIISVMEHLVIQTFLNRPRGGEIPKSPIQNIYNHL